LFLHSFGTAAGGTYVPQETTIEWLATQYAKHSKTSVESAKKRVSRFTCSPKQIRQRKTFLPEWAHGLAPDEVPSRNLRERMALYNDKMGNALESVLSPLNIETLPSHLLHVTCTGYAAPSIAQQWVSRRLAEDRTKIAPIVQHLYHLGCYASIPALRTAQGIVAVDPRAFVAIAHTEFCSLHVDEAATSPEQWVVQSLFADAVVKYTATSEAPRDQPSLRVLSTLERIAPDSLEDMTWNLTEKRFDMTLSRVVPMKIHSQLASFVNDLLERAGLSMHHLPQMIAAIHPGGPKIIDHVLESLGLDEARATWARKTLHANGNVSSATLPLLWKSLLEVDESPGRHVLCLAFGPGLTLAGAVLEYTEPKV
jgi:predicted naringenin-chalcone synthase